MGRDHGIPSYPNWLKECSPDNINVDDVTFDDMSKNGIQADDIKLLKKLYR